MDKKNMKTVILRISNNSLRFTIPADFASALGLQPQEPCRVALDLEANTLTIYFLPKQLPGQKREEKEIDVLYDPFAPKNTE